MSATATRKQAKPDPKPGKANPVEPEAQPESVEDAAVEAEAMVKLVKLPTKSHSVNGKPSVWIDRLNGAADLLFADGVEDGMAALLIQSKSPRGAMSQAVDLRKKLKDGAFTGLSDEAASLKIVTRGAVIYAVKPEPEADEADAEQEAEEAVA